MEKFEKLKSSIRQFQSGGRTYTVQPHDYLGKIASIYGLSVDDIINVNPGLNPDKIKVGQVITIPTKVIQPTLQQLIDVAWSTENPYHKGKQSNGTYKKYDDPNGQGYNVGPGLFVGLTIADKSRYTKDELDKAAVQQGIQGLERIGDVYNQKFGSVLYPTPFDTVSVAPKLLMLDTRYQNGTLSPENWPALYQAIADGDWTEALRQSRSQYTKDGIVYYDNDRVRRRAETIFPGLFNVVFDNNQKELPIVVKKGK